MTPPQLLQTRPPVRGAGGEPGAWGPVLVGGRRWRLLKLSAIITGIVTVVTAVAVVSTGFLLYQEAERNLTRVEVEALETPAVPLEGGNYLLVGSDRREGLDPDLVEGLPLGSAEKFTGQRSDTIMLVSVLPGGEGVSVVSFPRDLLVMDDGQISKLNEAFNEGPSNLIDVIRDNFGIRINHYVEVSVGGFLGVVDTLGSVEICIDDPQGLVDPKSGAEFEEPGCYQMTPAEALSYVRSREGDRGDFKRIDRQQSFMKAMIDELTSAQVVTDLPRLFRLVEEVAANVTTDEALGLGQMRQLAEELRGLAGGEIPMITVPGYTQDVYAPGAGTQNYVIAYEPGARAIFDAIRQDEELEPRGSPEEREATAVAVWSGGRPAAAEVVWASLTYVGYDAEVAGPGPGAIDARSSTTVYRLPGFDEEADWVAATLGAPVRDLPEDVDAPPDAEVVVAVGDDSLPTGDAAAPGGAGAGADAPAGQ